MTMPRYTVPRTAHCAGGELDPGPGTQAHYAWLPARPGPGNHPRNRKDRPMTSLQAWILVVEVGIIALAYLVGLFRGHPA